MTATATTMPLSQLMSERNRAVYIKDKRGDVVGGNYHVPKGDFARFLGFKPETKEEKQGNVEGWRTVEIAIQKEMNKLGESAMKNGMAYRNMYIANGRFDNEPGREKDMIASGLDSINESLEVGHASGIRYLEMQYKFHLASTNFGSISNLMKARSDSIKKTINEIR